MLASWMTTFRIWVYSLSIILFLVYSVGQVRQLEIVISALSAIAILLAIPKTGRAIKLFTLFFLIAGNALVWKQGITIGSYVLLYGDMLYLLTLFAMLPVLALPIKIGDYTQAIDSVFSKSLSSPTKFYTTVSAISYFMGILLNLATVPMMYRSIKSSVERMLSTQRERFTSVAILHGYVLPVIWTPLSGVVGVFVAVTHVDWLTIAGELILISICGLVFNWIFFYVRNRKSPIFTVRDRSGEHEQKEDAELLQQYANGGAGKKIAQIGIAVVCLIILIVTIDRMYSFGLVLTATVLALPFAAVWSLFIGKGKEYAEEAAAHFKKYIPTMSELFAIFLSAAFFAQAISYSHLDLQINEFLLSFNQWVGENVFLVLLPLIPLFFSFIGFHPIVSTALLGQALNPAILGINPEDMTVALLGGSVLTFYIGPFSGTLGVMSSLIRVSTFRILRWNLIQSFAFYIIVALFLLF